MIANGATFLVDRLLRKLLAADTLANHPELAVGTETMIRRASVAGIAAAARGMAQRPDSRPTLAAVSVPTLVVVGAEDAISPPAMAQQMAARVRGAELAIIPGAGHLAAYEEPEAVNSALRRLLRKAAQYVAAAAKPKRENTLVTKARTQQIAEAKVRTQPAAGEVKKSPPPPPEPRSRTAQGDFDTEEPTFAVPPRRKR